MTTHIFSGFLPEDCITDLKRRFWEPIDLVPVTGWYLRGIILNGDPPFIPNCVCDDVTFLRVEITLIRATDGKHLKFKAYLQMKEKAFDELTIDQVTVEGRRMLTYGKKGDKKFELTVTTI